MLLFFKFNYCPKRRRLKTLAYRELKQAQNIVCSTQMNFAHKSCNKHSPINSVF